MNAAKRTTLLVRFTVLGAVITALIALGFGWAIGRLMIDDALDDAVRQAAQTVTELITPEVRPEDFAAPTPARVTAWERRIRQVIGGSDIVRVKIWNSRGQIIYSDDPALVGRVFPLEEQEELREALGGSLARELSSLAKSENVAERGYGRLLEVYVPVIPPGTTEVVGVYEVYRSFAPLQVRISTTKRVVWGGSVVAFSLLYASLFTLVRGASRSLARQQEDLRMAFWGTIRTLAAAVDARDTYTGTHSSQIAEYAVAIAMDLGLGGDLIDEVRMAAYLHDVGKIGIPDQILRKAGPLSEEEWREMRRHSVIASQILEAAPLPPGIKLAVTHNHERWDGTGYPDGLRGAEIPLGARILAVADAYEAMTSDRPYRAALTHDEAVAELRRHAGTQFEPLMVQAFLAVLERQRTGRPVEQMALRSSL